MWNQGFSIFWQTSLNACTYWPLPPLSGKWAWAECVRRRRVLSCLQRFPATWWWGGWRRWTADSRWCEGLVALWRPTHLCVHTFQSHSFRLLCKPYSLLSPWSHGFEMSVGNPRSILYVRMSPWTILSLPGAASDNSCGNDIKLKQSKKAPTSA